MKLDRRAKSQQRKNREYWQQHLKTVQDHLFDVSRDEMLQKLSEHYTSALQKIRADMVDVLMKVSSGDYNMNELYKFNRYVKLQENLNKHLKELGQAEVDIMNQGFQSFYKQVDKGVRDCLNDAKVPKGSFSSVSKEAVKKAVEDIWCSDHQRWSSRIWKNKALLQQSLERGLVDCIARGASRETLVKDLMERMGVAYYEADRIVRTELAQIQNAAAIKRYKESGTKKVKTIACKDERVCKICKKKDGKLTDIDKAGPGISHLFHPNCRCLVVPVVDVPDYSVEDMERIAQEEAARLEKKEDAAITQYISSDSYKINEKLRREMSLTSEEKEYIKDLDRALERMEYYRGDLSRSLWFPNDRAKEAFLKTYLPGEEIEFLEYLSTTKGSLYNPDGQVQIFIQGGQNGKDVSAYNEGEQEVIYQRGSRFIVKQIETRDNIIYILLEEKKHG